MYAIINWDTNEVIEEHSDLNKAKRVARALGHTGKTWGKWYSPVAFVAEPIEVYGRKDWGCVYNPRFKAS